MSLKEKERAKEQQEKFQAILSALLKDEDNKYCVDCDAKGPRWASWNLGIFLCIRCAGIHRNLGVHIARVKSVNLDTWTAEQVAMMQEMGNSRGRAVYEANIPDGFRRPQSDSALEAFVRAKYEQKKYIAREFIPPTPKVPKEFVSDEWLEDSKSEKKRTRPKPASGSQIQLGGMPPKAAAKATVGASSGDISARPAQPAKAEVKLPQAVTQPEPTPAARTSAASDLLGLDLSSPQIPQAVAPAAQSSGNELLDLFGGPQPGVSPSVAVPAVNSDLMNGSSAEGNLFQEEGSKEEKKPTSTKDSIMALFGGTSGGGGGAPAQQMYNIPASSVPPAQNGTTSAIAPMPGSASNGFSQSMMNPSQGLPSSYSAQMGMMFGLDQPNQFQPTMPPMTNQQQQSSSNPPGKPQNTIPTQHTGTAALQAMNPFNPTSGISQSSDFAGNVPNQQSNRYNLTSQHQQTQVSFGVPAVMSDQSSRVQSLMTSNSAAASSPSHNQQPVLTGLTGMAPSPQTKAGATMMPGYGQSIRPPMNFGPAQGNFYGGMYMPQGQQQQAFPGMMVQPQNMMGQSQNMMGYQPNMMGQQPQGMMGTPAMNGSQMGMYTNQMMAGGQGAMYTPQQMQQMQFQQMQQQMAAMNMGGPQQLQGGWGGNPGAGQTLSNNLWQ